MKNLLDGTGKVIKGLKLMFSITILASAVPFIIQSCQREHYENSDIGQANAKFTSSLKAYKNTIGKISFSQTGGATGKLLPGSVQEAFKHILIFLPMYLAKQLIFIKV